MHMIVFDGIWDEWMQIKQAAETFTNDKGNMLSELRHDSSLD